MSRDSLPLITNICSQCGAKVRLSAGATAKINQDPWMLKKFKQARDVICRKCDPLSEWIQIKIKPEASRELRYACKSCHKLLLENYCRDCRSSSVSRNWSGMIIVLDPQRSRIARYLGITRAGSYAIKVR